MNPMTLIRHNGGAYIDSREVATLIGKQHKNLLRDIRGYLDIMVKNGRLNYELSEFFTDSTFTNEQNKQMPCYLVSKMGCAMIANKLTGEKGVLFTAAYVRKFAEMEQRELDNRHTITAMPAPRLGEVNACARIIVRGLQHICASPESILRFLQSLYQPCGIVVDTEPASDARVPRWYKASEIAEACGMYSLTDRPHSRAVGCLLNEIIYLGAAHKRVVSEVDGLGVRVLYDEFALRAVEGWLAENGRPEEIYGFERTYYVRYRE